MLKRFLKKHPKKLLLGLCLGLFILIATTGQLLAYFIIPSVFLWGDKVDITFNLPDNIKLEKVSVGYKSTNCKEYWLGTGGWAAMHKNYSYTPKQIGTNQYQVSVYFKDNFICQWQLEDIYWNLQYQDLAQVYPQVSQQNGGRGSEFNGYQMGFTLTENGTTNVTIHREYYPLIIDPAYYDFQTTRKKPIVGDLLVFKQKKLTFNGDFGVNTRHINYTATIEQPPFEQIPRTK